ncbi:hypothetical protein MUK42_28595 [Musa troglodytarum]|uniref:Uncharacterized protein n=1 Tax=Musa troglodytarum TaxID=320322 RepID=A0A9E7FQI7_9LILI|nr:hypothetical protein MUK42_28595 [Musa troglodytarum]
MPHIFQFDYRESLQFMKLLVLAHLVGSLTPGEVTPVCGDWTEVEVLVEVNSFSVCGDWILPTPTLLRQRMRRRLSQQESCIDKRPTRPDQFVGHMPHSSIALLQYLSSHTHPHPPAAPAAQPPLVKYEIRYLQSREWTAVAAAAAMASKSRRESFTRRAMVIPAEGEGDPQDWTVDLICNLDSSRLNLPDATPFMSSPALRMYTETMAKKI